MTDVSWTDERITLLRKSWEDGLSASKIAPLLGDTVSRNAVIGKLHRLGLGGRGSNRTKAEDQIERGLALRPFAGKPKARKLPPRPVPVALPVTALEPAPVTYEPVAIGDGVTLEFLQHNGCRWPQGDPRSDDFRYCGLKQIPGAPGSGPYCGHHRRLAYVPHVRTVAGKPLVRA